MKNIIIDRRNPYNIKTNFIPCEPVIVSGPEKLRGTSLEAGVPIMFGMDAPSRVHPGRLDL